MNLIDPLGEDAIVLTNENAVNVFLLGKQGHTSVVYQDENDNWFYCYWGDKAAAVIHISSEYMGSLSNFNKGLNKFLSDYGLKDITSDYTNATYVVGDFTDSLSQAYNDVNEAYYSSNNHINTLYGHEDGSRIFQGENNSYAWYNDNCLDRTYNSLSQGTLANGMNAGNYMKELEFNGGIIPNNAMPKFAEVFINSSFTREGAYERALNYATLFILLCFCRKVRGHKSG